MDIEKKIEEEYIKIDNVTDAYAKLNLFNNIIQLKKLHETGKFNNSIYSDIKHYFYYSILSIEETAFNYYELKVETVLKILEGLPIEEQLSLLRYLEREFKKNGFEEKIDWLKILIKKRKISYLRQNLSLKNLCLYIFEVCTYNILTIALSILILFVIYSVILLPAPFVSFRCFNSSFQNYSENKLLNHLMNSLVSFCSIDSEFKINPINIGGVLLMIALKLFLFLIIINYLIKELKSKIKL